MLVVFGLILLVGVGCCLCCCLGFVCVVGLCVAMCFGCVESVVFVCFGV